MMLIQIITLTFNLLSVQGLDCSKATATAITSQISTATSTISIVFTVTSATEISLQFPSVWSSASGLTSVVNPIGGSSACTLNGNAMTKSASTFTLAGTFTSSNTIACSAIIAPISNNSPGNLILQSTGDLTTCSLTVSGYQSYGSTASLTFDLASGLPPPTVLTPTTTGLQLYAQNMLAPISVTPSDTFVITTKNSNALLTTTAGDALIQTSSKFLTATLSSSTSRTYNFPIAFNLNTLPIKLQFSTINIQNTAQQLEFVFSILSGTTLIYELDLILTTPITPSALTYQPVPGLNDIHTINTQATYTFNIVTTLPADSIQFTMPTANLITATSATCDSSATSIPTVDTTNLILTIPGAGCLSGVGSHSIVVKFIKNLPSTASTFTIPLTQTLKGGQIVDQKSTSPTFSGITFTSATLTGGVVLLDGANNIVGGTSGLEITVTLTNTIPATGKLQLTIPADIIFTNIGSPSCTSPCQQLVIIAQQATIIFSIAQLPATSLTYVFPQLTIRNPLDTETTGTFTISTMDAANNIIDTMNTVPGISVSMPSPMTMTVGRTGTNSEQNGFSPVFNFVITTTTAQLLPFTVQISVGDLTLTGTPSCTMTAITQISFSTCTQVNTNTFSFVVSSTNSALTLAAGSISISVAAGAIKNKDTNIISQAFSVQTQKVGASTLMSQLSSGPTLTNTIFGTIASGSVTITHNLGYYGVAASASSTYTFSFTLSNILSGSTSIVINTPFTLATTMTLSCSNNVPSPLTCVVNPTTTSQIIITGTMSQTIAQTIIVSGLPTPSLSSASNPAQTSFSIATYRIIAGVSYQMDAMPSSVSFTPLCSLASKCKECTPSTSTCTSCYPLTESTNIYLVVATSSCVASCGNGYFQNTSTLKCQSCPSLCQICDASLKCTTCTPPNVLQGLTCVASCTGAYYLANPSDIQCSNCNSACTACSGSSTTCQSCIASVPFLNNQCLTTGCPQTYFQQTNSAGVLICASCSTGCTICTGTNSCTSCASGYFTYSGGCQNPCPIATYVNGTQCSNCITGCQSCSNGTACIACNTGYLMQNSICVTQCSQTYYDNGSSQCVSCGTQCSTCNATLCLKCLGTYLLYGGQSCVQTCPSGYYQSTATQCTACSTNCLTCSTTANTCLTCSQSGTTPTYLQGSSCTATCNQGYYASSTKGTCDECNSTCLTCSSASVCLSCSQANSPLYLYQGVCKSVCPDQYYAEGFTCILSLSNNLSPTRYVPVPFTILYAFVGITVLVGKLHKPETFVAGSALGLTSFIEWGSWITLGILYAVYEQVQVYYFYLLCAGVLINYIFNVIQIFIIRQKIYPDLEYQRWYIVQQNQLCSKIITVLSVMSSFTIYRLLISRYFGFTFFKCKLVDTKPLRPLNMLNGLQIVGVSVPIMVASALIAYKEPSFNTQVFVSAIDTFSVTFISILFLLWDTKKEDNYFDEQIPNYYSLNVTKLAAKDEDSGFFNNTFQKKLTHAIKEAQEGDEDAAEVQQRDISRASNAMSERLSMGINNSQREKFPLTQRPVQSNQRHTIYFGKKIEPPVGIDELTVPVDEESIQKSDPDQEPNQGSVFSSVKSQESDHGKNPFAKHRSSPLKDISVIQNSQVKADDQISQSSKLSIFDDHQTQFKPQQSFIRKKSHEEIIDQQMEQSRLLQNHENPLAEAPQELNQSQMSAKFKTPNMVDKEMNTSQLLQKQIDENKKIHLNKSQEIQTDMTKSQMNKSQFKKEMTTSQLNLLRSQIEQQISSNSEISALNKGFTNDGDMNFGQHSIVPKNGNSIKDQEPMLTTLDHVEQMQLHIENIDEIPQFSQTISHPPKVIYQNSDMIDNEINFDDEPIVFNKNSKQYVQKVKPNQFMPPPAIEQIFDFNESMNSMSDQEWVENQRSPSEFNSMNQRYEGEEQPRINNQIIRPKLQTTTVPARIQVEKPPSEHGSSDLELQGNMQIKFEQNFRDVKKSQQNKQLQSIYLKRNNIPKPQRRQASLSQRQQKDVSDAYINNQIDVDDIDF